MKILIVLRAPTGGLWRHAVDLAETLAEHGSEVGLAIDGGFSDSQTERGLARLEGRMSLGIYRLAIARQPGFADIGAIWAIRRLAAKLGVDIVHGHGAKGGAYARFAALGMKNRVSVYTPHGGVINYKVGHWDGDLLRRVETLMLGLIDAIAFESEFARKAYAETIGTPRCLWRVIHNGLGEKDFEPLPEPKERFDFAFVGELRSVKGVPVLLEALSQIRRPDGSPATLVLAGGGPEVPTAHALCKTFDLCDRVKFVGVQPAREVFAQSDCVVMPSLFESLPYVILEAAATGKQVIATDVGGVNEIFGPYSDRLIPAGDVQALKAAMTRFLNDPETGGAEGSELKDYVREKFNIARMTGEVERLYKDALAGRKA
ncbi:MAG: glycosyltransferase [Alphaproteobacteria bacterium]|nr:glycosyltransferase [Alphaproteobacteria bacterium]